MDQALRELIGEEFESQFTEFKTLAQERESVQDRLERARSERESVKESIFERVMGEYDAKLADLDEQMRPIRSRLAQAAGRLRHEIEQLDGSAGEIEDRIEEIDFRHRIGEFTDDEMQEKKQPMNGELDEVAQRRRVLADQLDALKDAGAISESEQEMQAEPAPPVEPENTAEAEEAPEHHTIDAADPTGNEAVDLSDLAEPVEDPPTPAPMYGRRRDDSFDFEVVSPQQPDAEAEENETADVPETFDAGSGRVYEAFHPNRRHGDTASKLIDPTDWVDEVLEPESDEGGRSDSTPATPAANANAKAEADADAARGREASPDDYPVLVITQGPGSGRKLPLLPMTMTIGREHDNNIEIKDEDVARYHARISFRSGKFSLEDLQSASGTWVNDKRVAEATLRDGDRIRVGGTEMMIAFSTKGAISVQ